MAIMPFKMENEHIQPSEIQCNTSDDRRGLKDIFDRHDNATNKYDRCRLREMTAETGDSSVCHDVSDYVDDLLTMNNPEIPRTTEGRVYVLQTWANAYENFPALRHANQAKGNLNSAKSALNKAKYHVETRPR